MSDLYIYNDRVESTFQLLGEKENDISYSVGFAFANCRHFLENFLKRLGIVSLFEPEQIRIKLQTHERDKGFTDFEIVQEGKFHFIIEAKRGWSFPGNEQLRKYASRLGFTQSNAKVKGIIIFNESTPSFTLAHFGKSSIAGIPLHVVNWNTVQQIAKSSIKIGHDTENRFLKDLNKYLEKVSTMQKIDSNWVYVVSLGSNRPDNWRISWQDIVNKKMKYFHPVGGKIGGWPAEPPNYIAFRYDRCLQSIHHIDKYEVFTDPSKHFPEIPQGVWEHHYLYHLGPVIKPSRQILAGPKIVRSMRVWSMLDLLLTSNTIEEARDKSKSREQSQ